VYAPFPGPSQGQPAPPVIRPRRSGLNWIRIAIIGIVGGLLIVGGLALVGSLEKGLTAGGTFGIPPDFPIYPGAGLIGVNEHIGSSGTTVNASWEADASLDTVTAFYSAQLNQQPWAITATNPVDGTWKFRRTDSKMTGLIRLSGHGQRTRIDVLLLK
jgi:hypothetical protein